MSILNPFQLLELNVISAQDLTPVSRSMRTYAVAWVHPDRKLSTRVDTHGHNNPTWNDKFVFRVDEDFLRSDTSAVMIEIYALHWFKDVHVGTVRILVGNLIPTPQPRTASPFHNPRPHHHHYHHPQLGMRFVALQVRRASGRPQGILNIGVALLHSAMRSMPLYSQLSTSAVGYRELMGEEDPIHHHNHNNSGGNLQASTVHLGLLSELRRTKSDVSSMIGSENRANEFRDKGKNGKKSNSMVNGSDAGSRLRRKGRSKGGSSLLSSVSGRAKKSGKGRQRKSSSVINGSEVSADPPKKGRNGKASSLINGNSDSVGLEFDPPRKGKNGKVGSLINGNLEVGALDPPKKGKSGKKGGSVINGNSEVDEEDNYHYYPPKKVVEIKPILKPSLSFGPEPPVVAAAAMPSPRVKPSPRFNLSDRGGRLTGKSPFHPAKFQTPVYEYGTPRKSALMVGGGRPFLTESELGPSPSEVAAAIAKQPVDESESSILEGWSVDESVEGLRSKLERWRTELPPVYDRGEFSSYPSSESRHARRHTDGGNGLFSCFSNICGVECSIVCGSGGGSGSKKSGSGRVIRSPSAENINNYK